MPPRRLGFRIAGVEEAEGIRQMPCHTPCERRSRKPPGQERAHQRSHRYQPTSAHRYVPDDEIGCDPSRAEPVHGRSRHVGNAAAHTMTSPAMMLLTGSSLGLSNASTVPFIR
jgi:hypothetical protein